MAVVTCTSRENAEALIEKCGGGTILGECTAEHSKNSKCEYVHVATYEGATLADYEVNGYHDSDFYAVVWTGERCASVEYGTTRFSTYCNRANIDATDEVKEAAAAHLKERDLKSALGAACAAACVPEKGTQVEFVKSTTVKGRRIEKGETGEVIWRGVDNYRSNRWATYYRVGVRLDADDEVRFTAEGNVEVTDAADRLPSYEEYAERQERREITDFASAFRSYGGALSMSYGAAHRGEQAGALYEEHYGAVTA